MGGKKKVKKKCCGKFKKKGKHCSSCPLSGSTKDCKPDKDYCKGCQVKKKGKKKKK
ncbi:MAG: hypothetical protein P8X86_20850 [Desulfofustis sp.]|jgi:hypothetical protein